ncbi:hypothetical protein IVB41_08925 [Bradyrhizobium sp. 44]|uniref:hypothetical protein n=1 Tax=Bradyrhizobium sp. 44 TaxID=2782675 RepID=UPI001FFB2193|nr:hypothetical protein [Bradyrhizobium sp. 44]MCK1284060.1 hypothetical protein [Bradyrhizobium sp. 44]
MTDAPRNFEEFTRPSGIGPLEGEERILAHAPKAHVIRFNLSTQADADADAYQTMVAKVQGQKNEKLAPLLRQQRELELAPQRHDNLIEDCEQRIARVRSRIAATLQKYEEDQAKLGGTPNTALNDFLLRQRVPLKDADTEDSAIDNRSPLEMMEFRRDEAVREQYQIEGLATSDCTWPEIEGQTIRDVRKLAKSPNMWGAKRFRQIGLTGRTAQGHVEFAKIRIDGRDHIDATGLLLSVPTIQNLVIDHLLTLARADYSEESAMTPRQRTEAVETSKAAKLLAERRAHFWHRKLTDEGTRVPFPTGNPWAILDVCE